MKIITKLLLILSVFVSSLGTFQVKGTNVATETHIIQKFQQEFNKIEAFANKSPKPIDSNTLMNFIDKEMMDKWSAELTIRAIVGKELWTKQSSEGKQKLIDSYSNTMRRYLFETFQKYNGQKPVAEKVQLNKKLKKGWLTVRLIINNFPDISVDLKLYRNKNQWDIYDFRFQGISFVKLKQHEYRAILKQEGALGLVKALNDKNKVFITALQKVPANGVVKEGQK